MKLGAVALHSERLRLVALEEEHLVELAGWVDEETWRYNTFAELRHAERRQRWAELRELERSRGDGAAFALISTSDAGVVGSTSLYEFSAAHRRVEIGRTFVVPRARRSFVNTEAKWLLLSYAFEDLGLNRVQLKTDGRNLQSQRAIERLGATREGVLRSHMVLPDGFVRDTVMYSVTRGDWPRVREQLMALRARH